MTCNQEEGCNKPIVSRGLCSSHYKTLRRREGLEGGPLPTCENPGCEKVSESRGLCQTHYLHLRIEEQSSAGVLCSTPGCSVGVAAKGLCKRCYGNARYGKESDRRCPVRGCPRSVVDSRTVCRIHRARASTYSLSVSRIISMHLEENYACRNLKCGATTNLHIDHDHDCCDFPPNKGKQSCGQCVRGWLCSPCNRSLGALRDCPERLRGLADYIESFQ